MDRTETFSVAGLVAPHPLAATAGRDVLIEGGSVVEAALAAAAVSAVVLPEVNGLGGDALWLIREPGPRGRVRVIDARGTLAPMRPPFRRERDAPMPSHGPEAVVVAPGAVAGWAEAHALSKADGGRMPLSRLLAPAAAAARDGYDLSVRDVAALSAAAPALAAQPGFADAFLADGVVPEAGTRRRNPALAATLDYLIGAGLGDVHRGDVARELAADLADLASPLERADLRAVEARWRVPHTLSLGRSALDVPPTRAGLGLAVAMGLLAGLDRGAPDRNPDGFAHWHGLIESLRAAATLLDAADEAGAEPDALLDAGRLARASLRIDRDRARRDDPPSPPILPETAAWIGAVDRDGAAVSLVQTLGGGFGSGVVSRRTGILMSNRGAALALGPAWRPGMRPPLRALPALLSGHGGSVTAFGATGSGAMTTAAQLASRLMLGLVPHDALDVARFALGATPDGRDAAVLIDPDREPPPATRLRSAGHVLVPDDETARGSAGAVARLPSGRVEAASPDGAASGL